MNERKDKTIGITIPKGYRSFKEELKIDLNKGLNVITGVNGSGKTQLLEYIYFTEMEKNGKESILLRTTKITNAINRFRNSRYRYYGDEEYNYNTSLNDILDKIEDSYIDYIHDKGLSNINNYQSAVYNAMFENSNYLYKNNNFRMEFFHKIANIVCKYIDVSKKQILKDFGFITDEGLDLKIKKELQKNGEIKKGARKYQNKIEEFKKKGENSEKIKQIEIDYFLRHNTITSKLKLTNYINDLLEPLNNLNGIILKLSSIIYNDAIENAKRNKTPKIWQKINEILNDYNNFRYVLEEPDLRINYKISFKHKNNKCPKEIIPFENLSSGEKIIFELICYVFIIKHNNNNKTKMLLLDEFDANLNPQLIKLLVKTIKKELTDKGIMVILTTHSPSTVAEVDGKELFSIENENDNHIFKKAENEKGKKEILEKLAPNFVYENELGFLGILAKTPKKYIIFVEGKSDKIHFETAREYLDLKDDYEFIDCGCASHVINLLKVIKDIDLFNKLLKDKIIIGLCDFDNESCTHISGLINKDYKDKVNNSSSQKYCQEIHDKINSKNELTFSIDKKQNSDLNIKSIMLTPAPESNFWKTKNFDIEHMYNIEKYQNEQGQEIDITKKCEKTDLNNCETRVFNDSDYENISFEKNPEYYKICLNDHAKIKFAEYVSKHQGEFENAFKSNFQRIFDIIKSIGE